MSSDERPNQYILVRHMARSPRTRTMRAARSGHRRQGVLLDDGSRVRRKGKKRYTQVDLKNFIDNHTQLLEYVRVGTLEICDPVTERAISYDDLVKLLRELGGSELKFSDAGLQQGAIAGSEMPENAAPAEEKAPAAEASAKGFSEEELMKMSRGRLNKVARRDYGVENPEKLANKEEVVQAIFSVAEVEE